MTWEPKNLRPYKPTHHENCPIIAALKKSGKRICGTGWELDRLQRCPKCEYLQDCEDGLWAAKKYRSMLEKGRKFRERMEAGKNERG